MYEPFKDPMFAAGLPMPENKGSSEDDHDLLLRYLDCAVINFSHQMRKAEKLKAFDTVRGVFFEGGSIFAGSRIREKTHIQIAVRDPKRILGYFWPKKSTPS
jgi:hypothetical protein